MTSHHDPSRAAAGRPLSEIAETALRAEPEFDQAGDSRQFWLWLAAAVLGGVVLLLGLALALAMLRTRGPFANSDLEAAGEQREEASETASASGDAVEELDTPEAVAPDRESPHVCPEREGEVSLSPSSATLRGGVQPGSGDGEELLVGWRTREAKAEWRFQVDYRGVYRVEVTYARTTDAGLGTFAIEIDGESHPLNIGATVDPGTLKTDEFFAALAKGQHTLVCRALTPKQHGLLRLQSIRLRRLSIL